MENRPPIGVMPEHIWKQYRLTELSEAIKRYNDALLPIDEKWIAEYNKLLTELKK